MGSEDEGDLDGWVVGPGAYHRTGSRKGCRGDPIQGERERYAFRWQTLPIGARKLMPQISIPRNTSSQP
jgi:hypothetical protein